MTTPSLQRLACLVGRHHRSHRRARLLGGDWRSCYVTACEGCGTPMIKDAAAWRRMTRKERRALAGQIPDRL